MAKQTTALWAQRPRMGWKEAREGPPPELLRSVMTSRNAAVTRDSSSMWSDCTSCLTER